RSNSSLYAQEWRLALHWSNQAGIESRVLSHDDVGDQPASAFEDKYAQRGHALYEVTSQRQPVGSVPALGVAD
ncbi:MAG: hypothetical protein RI542_07470, partial [Wenzhouxiangella sp.]|nr:hypothetical protein [Wenzhouxiangella sp.]